jgi:antitoxin HicB
MATGITIQNTNNVTNPSFRVVIRKVSEIEFLAEVPSVPYCIASGITMEEAIKNIQEVLDAMIDIMIEDGEQIPDDSNIIEYSISRKLQASLAVTA